MTVALLIITDGRRAYLEQMAATLDPEPFAITVVVDDSGDPEHRAWLEDQFPNAFLLHHPERSGLVAAVNTGWNALSRLPASHVFHVEEDFTFPEQPPLTAMVGLLDGNPNLANVVLKRQPWNHAERMFGGIIEANPSLYRQRPGYVAHTAVFSLNPCMYRAEIMAVGMPPDAEAGITRELVAGGYHFGLYGDKLDAPRCEHIGYERHPAWTL